jgi:hypothetical protein
MKSFGLILMGVIGAIFIFAYFPDFLKSIRSTKWVKLKATICNCGVDTAKSLEGGANQYSPWIEYEYYFHNASRRSPRVYLGGSSYFDDIDSKAHFSKYKIGSTFEVWADPNNAYDSVIMFGINKKLLFPVFFGVVLLVFAIYQSI